MSGCCRPRRNLEFNALRGRGGESADQAGRRFCALFAVVATGAVCLVWRTGASALGCVFLSSGGGSSRGAVESYARERRDIRLVTLGRDGVFHFPVLLVDGLKFPLVNGDGIIWGWLRHWTC